MSKKQSPSRTSLLLRPFGYALLSIFWLAMAVVGVLLVAYYGAGVTGGFSAPLYEMPGIANATFVEKAALVVIILPVMAAMVSIILSFVVSGSLSIAFLSLLYTVRSLMPKYAHEKISYSTRSRNTYRPPTVTDTVALSLLPVTETNLTKNAVGVYMASWNMNGKMFGGGFIIGVAFHAFLLLFNSQISTTPFGVVLWVGVAVLTVLGATYMWRGIAAYKEDWQKKLG